MNDVLWKVPITIKTKSSYPNVKTVFLLENQSSEINLGKIEENDWILLNSDYIGFYRTLYSDEMFNEIIEGLKKSDSLGSSLDRIAIINDCFALVLLNISFPFTYKILK